MKRDHQGKGIGTQLLTEWIKEVDTAGAEAFLLGTTIGLGLYGKFGFVVKDKVVLPLTKEVMEEPFVSYAMGRTKM